MTTQGGFAQKVAEPAEQAFSIKPGRQPQVQLR